MKLDSKTLLQYGGLTGLAIFYLSAVGMVETFNGRDIINGLYEFGEIELLTLGQVLVLLPVIIGGYMIARRVAPDQGNVSALVNGFIIGAISSVPMLILVFLGTTFPASFQCS